MIAVLIIALAVFVTIVMLCVNPHFNRSVFTMLYRPFSPHFPYQRKDFIGRDKDVKKLIEWIDFSNMSQSEITCIIGPPGIGKSSLAISVGNEMILNGAVVHYVNMAEFPDGQLKQVLAEKLYQFFFKGSAESENVTFDKLLTWANTRYWNNLIVLDNCEECINSQKQAFQEAIEDILDYSDGVIRFLITSREETMFFEPYYVHKLLPLNEDSACELLEQKLPSVLNQTEKKQIAELTGAMPLALQIIGSLLRVKVVHPPTPGQIIAKLKKNPIPTLSPLKLARSLQLNFSIGLSYNFLDSKLQKIGRYLALFPGSFNATSALDVLMSIFSRSRSPNEDLEYFTDSLDELVTRSLLEFDENTGRYNFHRLIKEFFLLYSNQSQENRFNVAFQNYFGPFLCRLSEIYYLKSPSNALAILDLERHNWLHFMTTINDPMIYNQALSIYKQSIACFERALYLNFLSIRFLPKELISPVRSITSILGVELLKKNLNMTHFFSDHFVDFICHLASLTEVLKGRDQAINEFMKRVDAIELLVNLIPNADKYIHFYEKFLKYESELGENKAKLYFERILNIARGLITCNDGCDYKLMGASYYHLGKLETSVKFYEKALEENYNNVVKLSILLDIRALHSILMKDTNKHNEVNEKLQNMFPLVINATSSSVYANIRTFQRYMAFLLETSDSNKTKAISEKMIESLSELGKGDSGTVKSAYILAKEHYDHEEFNRAAKVASYGIDSLQGLDVSQQKLMEKENVLIHMILSESAYYSANYSEANNLFVRIIDILLVSNQTGENFDMCCSYLMYLRNFDYIRACYSSVYNTALLKVKTCIQTFVALVFIIPLECNNDHEPKNMEAPLPVEMYPQVIQHSKSKGVSFNPDKELSLLHQDHRPLPFHSPSAYDVMYGVLKEIFDWAISYQIICFFINVLSVLIRLWLVYYCFFRLILYIFRCIYKILSCIKTSFIFIIIILVCDS